MGEIEKTSNAFDLYSMFTICRSGASTYCVSLSGCPWPAGHRCAEFCAQSSRVSGRLLQADSAVTKFHETVTHRPFGCLSS